MKTRFATVLMLLFSVVVFSQENYSLKGKITSVSDSIPIPGVNIINGADGVSSDFDGNYEISVKSGDVLKISYLGYASQTIVIVNQKTVNVALAEDASNLDEIVVVGYGTQKKSHLTGAISKVNGDKLEEVVVSRADDALVGQVAGVNIQASEGEAGSAPTIRIRGNGSITGKSSPAIVVDGILVDSDFLGSIDMNDVASFEVLKDAASGAIYGSRGGNGVVLITTKEGKEGAPKYSFSSFVGVKQARQSEPYYITLKDALAKERAETGTLSDQSRYKELIGRDVNYQDIIFDGGVIQNYSFGVRGGSKKTKYSTRFGYLHDEGVLLTDDYKKYNMKLRLDTDLTDRLKFGVSLTPSFTSRRRFDGSTHDILRQPSWLPVYHDENTLKYVDRTTYPNLKVGDYANQRHFDNYDLNGDGGKVNISNTSNVNPVAKILERDRNDYKAKVFASTYLRYKIIDGLTFETSASGDYQSTRRNRWQGVKAHRNGAAAAQLDISSLSALHMVTNNYFSYNKIIQDKHDISAVLGYSAEKYNTSFESTTGTGYTSDLIRTISGASTISAATSGSYESSFQSFFGRVNYAYDDKYLLSASLRRDGSSVFGKDSKYGNFPSISAGWIATNESFLKDNGILNFLKLRVSYGFTGNNALDTGSFLTDNYPSILLFGSTTAVVNNALATGFNPLNIANPELQWERSVEVNPGIDFGFLKNRISGSVEYYNRLSDNLLLNNPISSTTGYSSALVNIGKVENSGIEMEFRTKNIALQNFKWSSTFIASRNRNVLVDFADSDGQISNVDPKRAAEWINKEGHPISSFYGWVVDKQIDPKNLKNTYHPIGGQAQDVYVKDLNGDGIIDDEDKTILGDPYPKFIWSVSNEFKIYDFDFRLIFQGSHGAQVRNMADQYIFNHFNSSQDFDPATTPNQEFIKQKIFTNSIIQDASYVALRNITLGYNLPKDITKKLSVSKLRFYATGQNVLYVTAAGYTGFNPESINDTSPTTYGYQRGGSPIFSTYSMGINVEF